MPPAAAEPVTPARDGAPPATPKHCPACGERYPEDYAVCPRDATPLQREGAAGDDPMLGQVLGDTYEIVRLLGEGGMGRVYEVRHVRLGRRFALKLLHPHFASDAESVARFRREATAAAAVASPHIAQVVDAHITRDGRPYMVAELLEGEELGAVVKRDGQVEVGRAVRIARHVARGLAAAHAAGVMHRDLKPENVMLVRDGAGQELAKVLDFGIAKSLADDASLTRTGVVLGTPAYMAPEQVRASAKCDHRVDIYALGALLYRALTGRPAFAGDDTSSTLTSVLYDEPARPKTLRRDLPDGLEMVIQRAMAKSADDRFQTMAAVDEALAPFDTTAAPSAVTGATGAVAPKEFTGAATVALRSVGVGPSGAVDIGGARARRARPRAVFYALLVLVWAQIATASFVAACIQVARGQALFKAESVLAVVLAAAVSVPIVIAWARTLRAGLWRNTAAMAAHADALGVTLATALGAYAVISAAGRATVWLAYRALLVPRVFDLAAFAASIAAGVMMLLLNRKRER